MNARAFAVMALNAAGCPAGPAVLAVLFALALRRLRWSAIAGDPANLTGCEYAPT